MKRARAFFELQFEGLKPTAAAKAVAAAWQVSESTVFKDYARHIERLVIAAEEKSRELKIELGRILLRDRPDIAAEAADMFRKAAGENAAQVYDFSADEWLIVLGELHKTLLRGPGKPMTEVGGMRDALAAFLFRFGVRQQDFRIDVLH